MNNTYERLVALPANIRRDLLAGLTPTPEYEMHEIYNEMLDEVYGVVEIAGHAYSTSNALELVDPTAYRVGFADFVGNDEYWLDYKGTYYRVEDVERALDELE